MSWALRRSAVAALVVGALSAGAAQEKATLELAAQRTAYAAGETAELTAQVTIESGWHVNSDQPTYPYLIPTDLELSAPDGWPLAAVSYPVPSIERFTFAEEPLSVFQGTIALQVSQEIPATAAGPVELVATLTYQACNDSQCLPPVTAERRVGLEISAGARGARQPKVVGESSAGSLLGILLVGVLGGLILNAMPCVLPVLSLKIFGLVQSGAQGRREVRVAGLATSAGILVSYWGLAAAAVVARRAGAAVGWGVQFQEPAFVAVLAVIVVLFCLNLWGLFEIQLPGGLVNRLDRGPREGIAGHFASGLFATLMATPCSAPFLGTAVSFALAQPAGTVFAVFTAVGLGMALPYLALAASPGTARLLPKPGNWMLRLKGILGFLLAGAAIWLLYVLAAQVDPVRLAVLELGLLTLAMFVWLRHQLTGLTARRIVAALALLSAVGVVGAAAGAPPRESVAGRFAETTGLLSWQPFDRRQAEELAASGTPVFVDVTADWCLTCKVNENLVLETAPIAAAFARYGVVAMRADWTNRDEEISTFLGDHGRYSIPFYLLYRPREEPFLFGELLSTEKVLDALAALPEPGG